MTRKPQVSCLVLFMIVLSTSPVFSDVAVDRFIDDLEMGLTLSNYLMTNSLRAVLPTRFARDVMENTRGSRVGFIWDIAGDVMPESENVSRYSFDKEQLIPLSVRLELQVYEVPLTRFLQFSGKLRYFGEGNSLGSDFEDLQLFRSLSEKRIPDDGIPLFPGDDWAVEYFPLGSLSMKGEVLLFNHLQLGYGFENYDYAWTAFGDGGRFSARSALRGDKTATHPGISDYGRFRILSQNASVDVIDIAGLIGLSGIGPVSIYNRFSYSNNAYLGSHHFLRTGLPWVPAIEHTVFQAYNDLNVFSPFFETPETILGSVSFKPSFYSFDPSWGNMEFKLAEYDLFYNSWSSLQYLFSLFSNDPEDVERTKATIRESRNWKNELLRGGDGYLAIFGVGLTETFLYPYSVQGEPIEFSGGHRSWYFSTGLVSIFGSRPMLDGSRSSSSVFYFDLTVRGNSLDRVPSMIGLSDQGGVYFILSLGITFGLP
jgi:hypothetical protein